MGTIALGLCMVRLKGQPESPWSRRVFEATQLAPSLWPVIFSGIVGNSLKTCASWRAEHGIQLKSLEQLLGSLTMANTVLSAYTLSLFNTWTILLLIVWTFNPLGSQSSLRSLYLQDRSTFQTGLLSYIGESLSLGPSEAPTPENVYIGALSNAAIGTQYCNGTCDGFEDLIGRLGGRTAAAAQISTDPWGSPKIPRLRYVPGFDSSQPQNWLSVPWKERVLEYSSFIGKRIHGLDPGFIGNVTFTIVTSYIEVTNCSQCGNVNGSDVSGTALLLTQIAFFNFAQRLTIIGFFSLGLVLGELQIIHQLQSRT
ncbi:hypothetical protein LY78DRAFT_184471 [Colletotrichum sublineola]|nr:hypothetical protein LY78DRAFT_184471 [Colletotrichum sublineola]